MKALGLIGLAVASQLSAATITMDEDQKISVDCTCVLAVTPLCEFKLVDKLSGSQRQSWTQTNFAKAGVAVDLNAACYRKRDADDGGQGLCCEGTDVNSTTEKLFKGELRE